MMSMDTSNGSRMTIEYLPIEQLSFAEYNPRTLSQDKFEDLQRSLDELTVLEPAVVNKRSGRYVIVGGNQRVRAAKALAWETYPCHVIEVSLDREKAINARLNRSSGEDDIQALAEMLMSLEELDRELAGYNDDEILKLQDGWASEEVEKMEQADKPDKPKAYTKEQLSAFADNYIDPAAAKQFIGWLP